MTMSAKLTYTYIHDSAVRTDQLLRISDGISSFRKLKVGHKFVIAASGDRNFVVKPEQHHSSASTGWHPGPGVIEAWSAFLASLGAGFDHELEDPTFVRFLTRSGGQSGWILRTLDFGTAGYDPIRFADWQCSVSVL